MNRLQQAKLASIASYLCFTVAAITGVDIRVTLVAAAVSLLSLLVLRSVTRRVVRDIERGADE